MKTDPYNVTYKDIKLDPYRILELYQITHPAQAHCLKKLLRAGRSHKPLLQDIQESIDTLERWKQMIEEDTPKCMYSHNDQEILKQISKL